MNKPKTYSEATIEQLTAERDDLKKRVKELNDECEAQQYQFEILKKDPACVWANMLRGNIAIPSALVEAHDYQQIKSERDELRAQLESKLQLAGEVSNVIILERDQTIEKVKVLRDAANGLKLFCESNPEQIRDVPDDVWVPFCNALESTATEDGE